MLDWYVSLEGAPERLFPHDVDGKGFGSLAGWLDEPPSAGELTVHIEPLPSRGFDRATAFCLGGETELERSAHLCVAEASLVGHAPAHAPHVRRAYGTHLWWRFGALGLSDRRALATLQRAPERAVMKRRRSRESEGAALWFEYLDGHAATPNLPAGYVATAALALAATRTPPGALRWHAEPDVLDVLRSSLDHSRERAARFWDGFAQSRMRLGREGAAEAFLWPFLTPALSGSASASERTLLGGGTEGPKVTPTPAWELTASSLPRHFALPRPLAPTGSVSFVLTLDRPVLALALRATCEAPVSYVWSVARYDRAGNLVSTLLVPFQERQRITEQRIIELDGVHELVVSGTNLGGVDLAHPFDPDHEPFEPHGCSVYFAEL